MTTIYPKPIKYGKNWYFRYTDALGFRKKKSTGTANKTQAQQYIRRFIDGLQIGCDSGETLRSLLRLYADPETNPRYKDAQIVDGHYSLRHAINVAKSAKDLELSLNGSKVIDKPVQFINRKELKEVSHHLLMVFGHTTKAQTLFKHLKTVFSQAADDGLVQYNPAQGLADIKARKKKTQYAIPSEDIKLVISHEELFPTSLARDLFIVLASCGLRRSELLAMCPNQIQGNTLIIDRAFKDDRCTIVGTPKWDLIRIIPLPEIAKDPLDRIFSTSDTISISFSTLTKWFKLIGQHASLLKGVRMPNAWESLSPHMLRHSLNTMLRISGLPDLLVAEYMSWNHQNITERQFKIQDNYTHLYANNLTPVSDMIDKLIGDEGRGRENITFFSQA